MSGYGFTPLPDAPRRVARPEARFDRRQPGLLFGRATLTYVCEQPVHVGAGHKVVVDGKPVRAQVRRGADAIAPGSSWKGVTRSRFEAMTKACAGRAPKGERRVTSRTFDGFSSALAPEVERHPVFSSCRTKAGVSDPSVCPACALFGLMNRRSRVAFGDLLADRPVEIRGIAEQFSPRLHHLAEREALHVDQHKRRLTVRRLKGRKFHGGTGGSEGGSVRIEAIPSGATLVGELRFVNLTPAEMGGLLTALGGPGAPLVKLGAGKNLGFGRLRLTGAEFVLRDHLNQSVPFDRAMPKAWRAAFTESDDHWEPGEAALVALHRRGGW